ncbi:hypothetical protein Bca101_054036 [Brassica carinata]
MWGVMKKLNSELRVYQTDRKPCVSMSLSALIARITTKLNVNLVEILIVEEEERGQAMENTR